MELAFAKISLSMQVLTLFPAIRGAQTPPKYVPTDLDSPRVVPFA